MKKFTIEFKWAIIFSVVTLLWMILEKAVGLHSIHINWHQKLTMLFMVPAIVVYIFAFLDKKKNFYHGLMNYKQGLIFGFVLTCIITLLAPLTQWITSEIITPEYFPNAIAYSLKVGYHKTYAEAAAFFSLNNYLIQSVMGSFVMGMITSLVIAYFVNTKENS
jgi:hypothetical protein